MIGPRCTLQICSYVVAAGRIVSPAAALASVEKNPLRFMVVEAVAKTYSGHVGIEYYE